MKNSGAGMDKTSCAKRVDIASPPAPAFNKETICVN